MKQSLHPTHARILWLCITVFLLGCMLLTAVLPVCAAYPKPSDKVADEAGVLAESTIRTIKKTNESLAADVGASIAVCTVKTVGKTDIAEYANGLFKDWKLGEGVLILIAVDDQNYYLLQSVGVEKIITNEVLTEIRNDCLEEDFAAGNIDRGVFKSVNRLSSLLINGLEDSAAADSENAGDEEKTEEKGTTVGSVIIGFFKFILIAALILILAFAAFFIAAMFNDDCAAILQKYVFQRNRKNTSIPGDYYDERLYGQRRPNGQQNPQRRRPQNNPYGQSPQNRQGYSQNRQGYNNPNAGANRPNPNARRNPQNGYNQNPAQLPAGQNRQNPNRPTYYGADGQPRPQNRPNPNAYQQNGYNRNTYQQTYQQNGYSQSMNGDETRAFTIPTHNTRN